jgi:hypothetical protein
MSSRRKKTISKNNLTIIWRESTAQKRVCLLAHLNHLKPAFFNFYLSRCRSLLDFFESKLGSPARRAFVFFVVKSGPSFWSLGENISTVLQEFDASRESRFHDFAKSDGIRSHLADVIAWRSIIFWLTEWTKI